MHFAQPHGGAYAKPDPILMDGKTAEARVVTQVTRRLIELWKTDAPFAEKVEALTDNRHLWRTIAVTVMSEQNEMPDALRASLAGLAGFVDRQTTAVLNGGDVRPLVEINRRVIAGLTAMPEAA